MRIKRTKIVGPNLKINEYEKWTTHFTLAPLGYSTLLPSNNWAMLHVELLWVKQTIKMIIVPQNVA